MTLRRLAQSVARFAPVVAFALFTMPAAHAQVMTLSGRYQFSDAHLAGKNLP